MNRNIKLAPLFFIFFFALFLFLGVETGESMFSDPGQSTPMATSETPVVEGEGVFEVENPFLLLIQVDDLAEEEPQLDGVWLMSYGRGMEELLFFPLLPSQADDGDVRDQALVDVFGLNDGSRPHRRFFDLLEDRNLAWTGYLVLDRAALGELWRLVAEPSQNSDGMSAWAGESFENRAQIRREQAQFISALCQRMSVRDPDGSLLSLFDTLPGHIYLEGMSSRDLSQIWQPITQGGPGGCQFPTLSP